MLELRPTLALVALLTVGTGCMVGPEYQKPPVSVADAWIDTNPGEFPTSPDVDYAKWWRAFDDPALNELSNRACAQNLTLEIAGLRVVQSIAQRGIAIGQSYRQQQEASLSYMRQTLSENSAPFSPFIDPTFNQWTLTPPGAAWEIDLWGRIRRDIESADADLMGSLFNYRNTLASLLAEVTTTYVHPRTLQEQFEVARHNVGLQKRSVGIAASDV